MIVTTNRSEQLYLEARQYIPGGVNSPVRNFRSVGATPTFVQEAHGAWITDAENKKYVDYIGAFGSMIMGHAWQPIIDSIAGQLKKSTAYGLASQQETVLAKLINDMVSGVERVRLMNSGTEACMTAVRLARAATRKQKIIKFNGCYHGHADTFLVNASQGVSKFGVPSCPGVPRDMAALTIVAPYNNLIAVKSLVEENQDDLAAIIVEPIAGNMGLVLPEPGFLEGLRKITKEYGILLVFDEVTTGFRVAPGGAQQLYGVEADLIAFGNIIGGGFPVGALAGKSRYLNLLAPAGPVYQAGIFSGNPMVTTAGIRLLTELKNNASIYHSLEEKTERLASGIEFIFDDAAIPVQVNRVGSLLHIFFSNEKITNFELAQTTDVRWFAKFFKSFLANGVHLPPSAFETWFVSAAHTDEEIDFTLDAIAKSVDELKNFNFGACPEVF